MRHLVPASQVLLGLALVLCAHPLFSPRARACSRDDCTNAVRLFPSDRALADSVYFKLLRDDPGELTLHAADGTGVPASIRTVGGDRVFAPDQALAPGEQFTLTYTRRCARGPAGDAAVESARTFTFWSERASGAEQRPPSLTIAEQGYARPEEEEPLKFIRLDFFGPAGPNRAHLQDATAWVDGYAIDFDPVSPGSYIRRIQLVTPCHAPAETQLDSCGVPFWLAAGEHEVVVESSVVGSGEAPVVVRRKIDLRCETHDEQAHDASADVPDAQLEQDGGVTPPRHSHDGCSLATPSESAGLLSSLALCALALQRRRAGRSRAVR